jgi:shikimate kinase
MIFLIGFMGSGKTWYGRHLAAERGVAFIDLDQYIESQANDAITSIFADIGEKAFRDLETACLHQICQQHEGQDVVVSTGGGAPCFNDNLQLMRQYGRVIWVQASVATIAARLLPERTHRPLLANVPESELIDFISKMLEQRRPFYAQADEIIVNE